MPYPIIANANYEKEDSDQARAIHAARIAVDANEPWALTVELEDALEDLELALSLELDAAGKPMNLASAAVIEGAELGAESAYLAARAAFDSTRSS